MAALNKKTVDDFNAAGRRVLVRCDFNVPLKEGKITDETRIVAALPTIKKLIEEGAKVILCSHLGKPKKDPDAKTNLTLKRVAVRFAELLGKPVEFAEDTIGPDAKAKAAALKAVIAERLRKAGATTVAVHHPAWGHFAEAFGLEQIAVESHGQSPGARHLADFEKKIRERGVKTLLVQNEAERRRVAAFARKCGLRVVVVDPLAADVLGTLGATADALCGADAGAKPATP